MVVVLIVNNLLGGLEFREEIPAGKNRLLAQIAGAVEDLVDVEVHLEQAAQEGPEAPEERLPERVFLHALLIPVEVEFIGIVMLDWQRAHLHWLLNKCLQRTSLFHGEFGGGTGCHVHSFVVHHVRRIVEAAVLLGQGLHN